MKIILNLISVSILLLISQITFGQAASTEQTEEYAIISVTQVGSKNYISITIGSVSTEEKEYEKQKNAKQFDMAPIIAEMEKLNKMGYKLFNSSAAMIPIGQYSGGYPFYCFVFKKEK
jgi:hypothetical protein